MTAPKPVATHTLRNGWKVLEVDSTLTSVYIADDCISAGALRGRFHFRLLRVPYLREVKVMHFIGATPKERAFALKVGRAIASGQTHKGFPWKRYRCKNGRNWYFAVVIGTLIREAEEFERLRRGLHTDDSIELEFRSIVQQLEGTKA